MAEREPEIGARVERELELWIRAEHKYRRYTGDPRSGIRHCIYRRGFAKAIEPHD